MIMKILLLNEIIWTNGEQLANIECILSEFFAIDSLLKH